MIDRLPPYNEDAEKSILAAILFDPEYADDAFDLLRPEHFYRESHQVIFKACLGLRNSKQPIGLLSVKEKLTTSGDIEKVGGNHSISSILDSHPLTTDITYSAKIIKDKAVLRDMIRTGQQITPMGFRIERGRFRGFRQSTAGYPGN